MSRRSLAAVAICLVLASAVLAGCGGHRRQVSLVFAGSLVVPFDRVATAFERQHQGVTVTTEGHGSIQAIRQVTDLGRRFDVVVTADAQLLPALMFGRRMPGSSRPFASWDASFATNRLVLAFSPRSPLAARFTTADWYKLLAEPRVRLGLSDPRFDPAGYRSLMVLQLAAHYYHDPLIFENVVMGQFTSPIIATPGRGRDVIHVPETLATRSGSHIVLRDESIELDALLESGDLDCAFEYESVARQDGLHYLRLPAAVDLGEAREERSYRTVAVRLAARQYSNVPAYFVGDVIKYALTIPNDAPDPGLAAQFVAFLLGPRGRRILGQARQPLLASPTIEHAALAPEAVRRACAGSRP
jgi:molybdate/tungstate transport system substrate-binding protein